MEDMNTRGYLDRVKGIVLDHLRHTGGPPSVQMSGQFIPSSLLPHAGLAAAEP